MAGKTRKALSTVECANAVEEPASETHQGPGEPTTRRSRVRMYGSNLCLRTLTEMSAWQTGGVHVQRFRSRKRVPGGNRCVLQREGSGPAAERGIRCKWVVPEDAFMVAELHPGALAGVRGQVSYRPEFDEV